MLERLFYIPGDYEHVPKQFPFFTDDKPIIIEYCSGNGQWIGERAKQNPQFNWLAVEKRFERARKIWLKIHREGIDNLTVVCGDGLTFTKFYAPPAVEIYVNFPDPWPKLRHAKHRIISKEFLTELLRIVVPGGQAICVTDDEGYSKEMVQEFSKCPEWKFLFHLNDWPEYGRSFFNDLWLKRGKIINYISHEKL
jgi:tRNA (guanine-N7-)-methyltransferase